jgi:hypothetical protein
MFWIETTCQPLNYRNFLIIESFILRTIFQGKFISIFRRQDILGEITKKRFTSVFQLTLSLCPFGGCHKSLAFFDLLSNHSHDWLHCHIMSSPCMFLCPNIPFFQGISHRIKCQPGSIIASPLLHYILQRLHFQIRSDSQVPEVRISTYLFEGNIIQYTHTHKQRHIYKHIAPHTYAIMLC